MERERERKRKRKKCGKLGRLESLAQKGESEAVEKKILVFPASISGLFPFSSVSIQIPSPNTTTNTPSPSFIFFFCLGGLHGCTAATTSFSHGRIMGSSSSSSSSHHHHRGGLGGGGGGGLNSRSRGGAAVEKGRRKEEEGIIAPWRDSGRFLFIQPMVGFQQ